MSNASLSHSWSPPTRSFLPLILIRGFGGLDVSEEKKSTYQGFNDGSVYPQKQGENYIYEGLILRFLKSNWKYQDATNVVGYYGKEIQQQRDNLCPELQPLDRLGFFSGSKVVIDPAMALRLIQSNDDPSKTLWVFRYYDLDDRAFKTYGQALVRLIDFIRTLIQIKTPIVDPKVNKVNIIAHSMGGLIVREAIQSAYQSQDRVGKATADESINKIVTLGTPHQGISFQVLGQLRWLNLSAEDELKRFDPNWQDEKYEHNPLSYKHFGNHFPLERLLTVVGTNYRTYNIGAATVLNRLFSVSGEYGPNYNRSDGLVKQAYAQIPGAPRTFVNKCHGGFDSLITARESFEVATRFFFGDVRVRLRLVHAKIKSGRDIFGKSEFFLGVSIKPRSVDFELFHQSKEAENCYGPFRELDLSDREDTVAFPWAGKNRLIWEGFLLRNPEKDDLVMRLEIYVGERDFFGMGFSDNLIVHEDYFVRAVLSQSGVKLYLYPDQQLAAESETEMTNVDGGFQFSVNEKSFDGTFVVEFDNIPDIGQPKPFTSGGLAGG
ncbi:hypothetical protein F7734_09285 [Scytonema sp. UIC 10036]|uniref:esterase/lipase family protein n=1 Tax=Scytonema sp. UIC 10036 TaxID=2304196 RepID=UPI0012DA5820|nr:hypothetical protein [Scytonema sp. UIC 10036]MUG92635.1 hypothetical protein [Scytonema sp. UIC 10036]